MQNKLNEILELCIEKSKNGLFYTFHYKSRGNLIFLSKENDVGTGVKFKNYEQSVMLRSAETDLDQVLEQMQNE